MNSSNLIIICVWCTIYYGRKTEKGLAIEYSMIIDHWSDCDISQISDIAAGLDNIIVII